MITTTSGWETLYIFTVERRSDVMLNSDPAISSMLAIMISPLLCDDAGCSSHLLLASLSAVCPPLCSWEMLCREMIESVKIAARVVV